MPVYDNNITISLEKGINEFEYVKSNIMDKKIEDENFNNLVEKIDEIKSPIYVSSAEIVKRQMKPSNMKVILSEGQREKILENFKKMEKQVSMFFME